MTDALDQMLRGADEIRAAEAAIAAAYNEAIGVGADHESEPAVLAVFQQNRLVGLEIDQSILDLYRDNPTGLSIHISSVMRCAYTDWKQQVGKAVS